MTIPSPGRHVALNALAAIGVALELGIEFEVAARALAAFSGIIAALRDQGRGGRPHRARRLRASSRGGARDAGARRARPSGGASWRFFSRIATPGCATCSTNFSAPSTMPTCSICSRFMRPARSRSPGSSSRRLYEALRARGHLDVRYLGDEPDAAARVAADSAAGDLIVTLGAGDVYKLGEARAGSARRAASRRPHERA